MGPYLVSFGVFALAGGVTHWLAIKMLFDRIPLLYGSGIILRNFREIRTSVKDALMSAFFDEASLQQYLKSKISHFLSGANLDERIKGFLNNPAFESIIDRKLDTLSQRPEGLVVAMMGVSVDQLKPMIKPFIMGLSNDIAPLFSRMIDPDQFLDLSFVRMELDGLMNDKLKDMDAKRVRNILKSIMKDHLGWLIVWGNLLGGIIGVVTQASRFGHFVGC